MTDKPPFTAVVISETHWDRAWYLPFQTFRIRLVRLIDRLWSLLEEKPDFRSFMLDGQMLPVEDYLEIRPDQRDTLKSFVESGRLYIGPWYALADEFMVSPEALVRNLSLGVRMAEELGGAARVGYVPDAFGHINQLPQILRGFAIHSAVFWRGMGDEAETLGDEFWWEAPDGSRVLTLHLRDGYHNAANLGYPMRWGDVSALEFNMDLALARLQAAVDFLKPYNKSGLLPLFNGIDHADVEPRLPEILAQANDQFSDVNFVHGNLPDLIEHVHAAVGETLPSFQGEMNRSRYGFGLQGVYSSRVYLQQANERAQSLLEIYAEPLSAWAWLQGQDYPAAFLDLAWRTLIQNHPHDDICGCSVDEVHRENMVRFDHVHQIGHPLARDSFRFLMKHIDRGSQPGEPFVVYNPTAAKRTGTCILDLYFHPDDPAGGDFHLVDSEGLVIPTQIISSKSVMKMEVGKNKPRRHVQIAAALDAIPSCGYQVLYVLAGKPERPSVLAEPVRVFMNGMENRDLQVTLQPDGTLRVLDKRTNRGFTDLLQFSDDEDSGDEYDYSPARNPDRISTWGRPAEVTLLESGPLQASYRITHELSLPEGLTPDRQRRSQEQVSCTITTTVTLRRDSDRVEVKTTFDNQARDHRLRVLFPTDLQTETAEADGHFDVVSRPIAVPEGDHWDQPPVPTRHQRYFVDLSDGETGLAIYNRGLSEFEILKESGRNTIAVTLLRGVGFLSCGDLLTRPGGHAGPPNLATPDAQCLGTHTFHYAIVPHTGDWQTIYPDAYNWRAPIMVRSGVEYEGFIPNAEDVQREGEMQHKPVTHGGELPQKLSFLRLSPEILTLSAVKRAVTGDRLIMRFYNPSAEDLEATLQLHWPIQEAFETNLNEEVLSTLPVEDQHTVRLAVGGKTVKTIALKI